jgi:outer membrane protein assembly factor BamA
MTSTYRVFRAGVSVALLACSLPLLAQRTYTAGKIVFKTPGEFSQADLESVLGMHTGDNFKQDDLNAAAQRLSDTGYFDTVGGALEGMSNRITVTIDLKPSAHDALVHAGFHNFVWLTPEEIQSALRASVPLYNGYLPEGATQLDTANHALTQALSAKGIQAKVDHETVEPSLEHPERVVEFTVVEPSIRVSNVRLGGVVEALVPYVQKSLNETAHKNYNAGRAGKSTERAILDPLLDAGYINASLSNVSVKPSSATDGSVTVEVAATLVPDVVYKVGTIRFAGAPLMSADEFAAGAKLHAGDIASHKLLMDTVAPLDAAYRRKGYMDVIVTATPTLDSASQKVDYAVSVVPGEPYKVHEVTAEGLEADAAARAEFDRVFPLKPGDVYDPYAILTTLKPEPSKPALRPYSAGFKAQADPAAHTVDVLITFYKTGGR